MSTARPLSEPESPAETLTRAAKAVTWALERYSAPELARIASLSPDADQLESRVVVTEALTYTAAHTYALCLMTRSDADDAGRLFRSDPIQGEMRMRARRVIESVLL